MKLLVQGSCDVGWPKGSQERSCENKIQIYPAFEGGRREGGGQVMEWGLNSSKNGPGTCQWINNLLLTALPPSHREILKYSLKRGILSWINTSQNPIQSVVCGHIEHAKQKQISGVDAQTFYHHPQ